VLRLQACDDVQNWRQARRGNVLRHSLILILESQVSTALRRASDLGDASRVIPGANHRCRVCDTWAKSAETLPCSGHVLHSFMLDFWMSRSSRIKMPSEACHPQSQWRDGSVSSVKRRCLKYWPLAGKRVGETFPVKRTPLWERAALGRRCCSQSSTSPCLENSGVTVESDWRLIAGKFLNDSNRSDQRVRDTTGRSNLSAIGFWRRGFNTPTVRHSNAPNGLDEPTVGVAERKPLLTQ